MTFLPTGRIGHGKAGMEQFWNIYEKKKEIYLEINSGRLKTCVLCLDKDKVWRGYWNYFEKMPIEILQLPPDVI
jgi:hypothetical protein